MRRTAVAAPKKFQMLLYQKQADFLASQARYRGFVGGRGAGKSVIGSYDLIVRASVKPNRLFMVVTPTYKVAKKSTWRTFLKMARKLGVLAKYNKTDYVALLTNGTEVAFKSAEDPDSLRGPTISGLWIDEAQDVSYEAFLVAIGCLREDSKHNWVSATFTPKGRLHWTYSTFAKPDADGNLPESTEFFHATTSENPFLPPNFEHDLRRQYTSATQQQELEAEFLDIGGTLFHRDWFVNQIVGCAPREGKRVRGWDKACLVAGTMVDTLTGRKPIERIRIGEYVLTRQGYRRVLWSGMTKVVNELTAVRFSNGSVVTGTGDHPVWTENRGWVSLDQLLSSDRVVTNQLEEEWPASANSSFSMAGDTTASLGSGTSRQEYDARMIPEESSGTRCSIGPYGNSIMVRSRMATMSTTKTTTGTITTSVTSSCSPGLSIADYTMRSLIGILARKRKNNERGIGERHGITPSTGSIPAWHAARSLSLESSISQQNSVQCCVVRDTEMVLQNQRIARFAELISWGDRERTLAPTLVQNGTGTQSARTAERSSRGTKTLRHSVLKAVKQKIDGRSGGQPVYDLEIEGVHEFFANGILVHNSTKGGGCWTCGVLMCLDYNNRVYVEHVIRGQWTTLIRDEIIQLTAALDQERYGYGSVRIFIEQEPGSSGADSVRANVRQLAGHIVHPDRPTGDKRVRAEPFAAQCESRNVFLCNDDSWPWISDYIDELCLREGTPVLTYTGEVPIESVQPGDLVLTRQGWRRVLRSHQTNNAAQVYRVVCAHGNELVATGNHPVFVPELGFTPVSKLMPGMLLSRYTPDGFRYTVVSTVSALADRRPVYNLEINDCHEFVAAGLLVHNCQFPDGKFCDQVDASSLAYNQLTKGVYSTPAVGTAAPAQASSQSQPNGHRVTGLAIPNCGMPASGNAMKTFKPR